MLFMRKCENLQGRTRKTGRVIDVLIVSQDSLARSLPLIYGAHAKCDIARESGAIRSASGS